MFGKRVFFVFAMFFIFTSCALTEGEQNSSSSSQGILDQITSGFGRIGGQLGIADGINQAIDFATSTIEVIGQQAQNVIINADGTFSLDVDLSKTGSLLSTNIINDYQILVRSLDGSYGAKMDQISVSNGQISTAANLTLNTTGRIDGIFHLEGQSSYSGIRVYLAGTSLDFTTGSGGMFSLTGVPAGNYELLIAEKDGYKSAIFSHITVTSDGITEMGTKTLLLDTGSKGRFVINSGSNYTTNQTVTLNIGMDSNAILMRVSDNAAFVGSAFGGIQTETNYTFTSDGYKTLYMQFMTANGIPSATYTNSIMVNVDSVNLTYPAKDTSIADLTPKFQWDTSKVPQAIYHFQLASDNSFSTSIINTNISTNVFILSAALTDGSSYYWRVAVIDPYNTQGDWSEVFHFNVALGGTISQLTPADNTLFNTSRIAFDWSDSSLSGASYTLQMANDINFNNVIFTTNHLTISACTNASDTLVSDTYYWRIAVEDSEGGLGQWYNDQRSFTIALDSVSNLSPFDAVSPSIQLFSWSKSSIPDVFYRFQLSDNTFTSILFDTNVYTNSLSSVLPVVTNGATYSWRVGPCDANGVQGNWSEQSIVVDAKGPAILSNYNNTLNHNQVFGTNTYSITVTVQDEKSEISNLYYNVDGGSFNTAMLLTNMTFYSNNRLKLDYKIDLTLSTGTHTVNYYAQDKFGNNGSTNTFTNLTVIDTIYVSTNGNDNGKGSKDDPLLTITTAIEQAKSFGLNTVYVGEGTYTPGAGLSNSGDGVSVNGFDNLQLIGGWNSAFDTVNGMSVLDAQGNLTHTVYLISMDSLYMKNFKILNANNTSGDGGGIYASNLINSTLTNLYIASNFSQNYGGGMYLINGSSNNLIVADIVSNRTSDGSGGGIYMNSSSGHNIIRGNILSNYSGVGGGIWLNTGWNQIEAVIADNIVSGNSGGGGIDIEGGDSNTIAASIVRNIATSGGGGGIYVFDSDFLRIENSDISGNGSSKDGAALKIQNISYFTLINSTLTNNAPGGSDYSVIYLWKGISSDFSTVVITNNIIGATNNSGLPGITEANIDITGQILEHNAFVTNKIGVLYNDVVSNKVYVDIDWTKINDPSFTGATAGSTNNYLTNL